PMMHPGRPARSIAKRCGGRGEAPMMHPGRPARSIAKRCGGKGRRPDHAPGAPPGASRSDAGVGAGVWGQSPHHDEYDWAYGEPSPWASLHSDALIHADVSDRLVGHIGPWVDDIDVFVREGEVILVGIVDDPRIKYLAQDIADDVAGVVEVHNHLRVRSVDDTRFGGSRQWTRGGS